MTRLAHICYRRRWFVLLGWILAAVGLSAFGGAVAEEFRFDVSLPGTESQEASDLLTEGGFGGRAGFTGQVVVASDTPVTDPAVQADIERLLASISGEVPEVGVISPYAPGGEAQIAPSGTVAYAELDFGDIPLADASLLAGEIRSVSDGFEPSSAAQIELGGDLFFEESEFSSEGFGMLAAIVILLVAFGSLLAMGLPLLTALFGMVCGFALVNIGTTFMDVPDFASALVSMMAIGVGIDYALFVVTRYREQLHAGADPETAVVGAIDTAGRAVVFAGATVVVSLLGLIVVGLASIRSMAFAAAAAVLMVMLVSITLLPALLGFIGPRIDKFGLPHRRRRVTTGSSGWWYRWSRLVQHRPWPAALAAAVLLVVLAAPVAVMRLGFSDAGGRPTTDTTRRAFDLIAEGFGPGFNGPLILAVSLPPSTGGEGAGLLGDLESTLSADDGVAAVMPPFVNEEGSVALVQAFPATGPQDAETMELVGRIRDSIAPELTAGTEAQILVGGSVAGAVDFAGLQARALPQFMGAVLVVSFLLLLVTFRSLLVPLKAVIMNLLSIGAAYGIVVAVFQWGWGAGVLGIETGPVEAWAPMMMFAIVFGLSMDYEVFLLSRIKEEWERTGDNATAVADGLARTARLITAAAAIMVCVFGGFVLSVDRDLQLFGLGLAVAVLLDATIVRLVLVPATMELLGDRNWWLPRWLGRLVPNFHIEGTQAPPVLEPVDRSPVDPSPLQAAS
jgi:RND superfamily putative drug exporter